MKSFLDHIRLECKILEEGRQNYTPFMKAWLAEGQGIPDQLENMLEAILSNSIIERRYGEWQKDPTITYVVRFDMYPLVKDIKRNFIGPGSILTIKFSKSSGDPDAGGVYGGDREDPSFNRETGLLENAEISLRCSTYPQISFEVVQKRLRSSLSHELVHAFEDFNRQSTGGRSLMQALSDRSYPGGPEGEDREKVLAWLAYILDPAEQKTFIAQTALEVRDGVRNMKRTGRLDRFENIRNIDRILEMTEFWKAYEGLRSWVEETPWERMPKWRQEKIVALYNSLVKKDDLSPFNRPVTTYNQFLKKLRHRWRAFDHDLKNRVSQAAATALYTERPTDPALPKREKLSESIFYQAY